MFSFLKSLLSFFNSEISLDRSLLTSNFSVSSWLISWDLVVSIDLMFWFNDSIGIYFVVISNLFNAVYRSSANIWVGILVKSYLSYLPITPKFLSKSSTNFSFSCFRLSRDFLRNVFSSCTISSFDLSNESLSSKVSNLWVSFLLVLSNSSFCWIFPLPDKLSKLIN